MFGSLAALRASPSEPPIRPRPMTVMRSTLDL
jgi:hypothetical protein